jgi:NAD(P)-dependent dehydrogenase (short-subunit alcohol dehydrogenase family)
MHLNAAATYVDHGVRINCVAPGVVASAQSAPLSQQDATKAAYPMKRVAEPMEVAEVGWGEGLWVTVLQLAACARSASCLAVHACMHGVAATGGRTAARKLAEWHAC